MGSIDPSLCCAAWLFHQEKGGIYKNGCFYDLLKKNMVEEMYLVSFFWILLSLYRSSGLVGIIISDYPTTPDMTGREEFRVYCAEIIMNLMKRIGQTATTTICFRSYRFGLQNCPLLPPWRLAVPQPSLEPPVTAPFRQSIDRIVATLGVMYRYLPPTQVTVHCRHCDGDLAGFGVEIGTNSNGMVMVSATEDKSPPSQSHRHSSGRSFCPTADSAVFVAKSTPDDVALKLGGPKGSKVRVVAFRIEMASKLDLILTTEPHHHIRQRLSLD